MSTADQEVAEQIGRGIDGRIFRLNEEKAALLAPGPRIAAINAQLAILQDEKTRIDARRPPNVPGPPNAPGPPAVVVDAGPPGRVK